METSTDENQNVKNPNVENLNVESWNLSNPYVKNKEMGIDVKEMLSQNLQDKGWSDSMWNCKIRDAINSALVELVQDRHQISALVRKDEIAKKIELGKPQQLTVFNGVALKLKFVLTDFVKLLLLSFRNLFDEDCNADEALAAVADFSKTFLNAVCNEVDQSEPQPEFLGLQTLEEVVHEAVSVISDRFPLPNLQDREDEAEDVEFLVKKYSRHILTMLVGLGVAIDFPASVEILRLLVALVGQIVSAKKKELDAWEREQRNYDNAHKFVK